MLWWTDGSLSTLGVGGHLRLRHGHDRGARSGFGMFLRARRQLLATLRERAETAEAEQRRSAEAARQGERTRIAREMHDVLAHRISLVSMHAGALEYRGDASAEEVRTAAGVIRENAHQALVDLREVIGVLRGSEGGDAAGAADDGTSTSRPQPTLDALDALLDETRAAGVVVRAEVDLAPDPLPATTGRTAYRVLQEGLTNARKHGRGGAVTVCVRGTPADGLSLEVRNSLRPGAVLVGGAAGAAGRAAGQVPGSGVGPGRAWPSGPGWPGAAGSTAWWTTCSGCTSGCPGRRAASGERARGGAARTEPAGPRPRRRRRPARALGAGHGAAGRAGRGAGRRGGRRRRGPRRGRAPPARTSCSWTSGWPRVDGLQALAALRRVPGAPEVVVLTTFDADDQVVRAVRDGAAGFLLKDTPPAEIVDAVRRVADGEAVLDPSVTRGLLRHVAVADAGSAVDERREAARRAMDGLSEREREVALAVSRGLANAQIAEELFMSPATVKAYVSRLLQRLGLDNRVQVALLAHDAGLTR